MVSACSRLAGFMDVSTANRGAGTMHNHGGFPGPEQIERRLKEVLQP